MKMNFELSLLVILSIVLQPFAALAVDATVPSNNLKMGPKSSANKSITFDINAGAANPKIRANGTTGKLEFANDGTSFKSIGSGSGGGAGINLLDNGDIESGINSGFANSGGTFQEANSTTNSSFLLFDAKSIAFTATAAGQYVQSSLVTIPNGLAYKSCIAQVWAKGGDANLTIQVLDASSNLIASQVFAVGGYTNSTLIPVPFGCGAAGSQYRSKIVSTAAAATAGLDRFHLGELAFLSFVDAVPINVRRYLTAGTFTYTPTDGTRWTRVRTIGGGGGGGAGNGVSVAPTAGGSSSYGTLVVAGGGGGGSPATGGAGGTFTVDPSVIDAHSISGSIGGSRSNSYYSSGGQGGASCFSTGGAMSESAVAGVTGGIGGGGSGGGGPSSATSIESGAGGGGGACANAIVKNPTVTTITVGGGGNGGTGGFAGGTGGVGGVIIEEYGYASGQAFTPSTVAWRVDATIGSSATANVNLGNSNISTGIVTPGTTLSIAPTASSSAVGMACAGGTTNAVGTLSCGSTATIGLTFNVPVAGTAKTCFDFGHNVVVPSGAVVDATFSIVETPNNATTITQVSPAKAVSYAATLMSVTHPIELCGNLTFATAGQKTVRLAYAQAVVGSPSQNLIITDQAATIDSRNVHVSVEPISQNVPAPILVGPFAQMPSGTITSATYNVMPSDSIVDFDTTSNAITATLPSAVGMRGKTIRLIKSNAGNAGVNPVTVNPQSGQTIGGYASTKIFSTQDPVEIMSDGANWKYVSGATRSANFRVDANCTTGTCSITSQSGEFTVVTRTSQGRYVFNMAAGAFQQIPSCSTGLAGIANPSMAFVSETSSFVDFQMYVASTGAASDGNFKWICVGPR